MKRLCVIFLLLVILVIAFNAIMPSVAQALPEVCKYAAYGPHYLRACIIGIMFEFWDPLDWDD